MSRHRRLLLFVLLLGACAPAARAPEAARPAAAADTAQAAAQAPPATDIYLASLSREGDRLRLGTPVNLTHRAGYDNQPSFTPDGRGLLYTSIREDAQADIYRYDLESRSVARVTRTAESEYSPTVMPGGDAISVVRVEADSTQRLWRFGLDGSEPRLILEQVRPVGYHAWADASTLALFVLGEPPTLQLADTRIGRAQVVAENIGRSLHPVPGRGSVSFVHKATENEWWIRELDLATREITTLVRTLPGAEDYAWMPDGTLLMAQGSRLFLWRRGMEGGWQEVADLAGAGLQSITRLAVSAQGDRLALVAAGR